MWNRARLASTKPLVSGQAEPGAFAPRPLQRIDLLEGLGRLLNLGNGHADAGYRARAARCRCSAHRPWRTITWPPAGVRHPYAPRLDRRLSAIWRYAR